MILPPITTLGREHIPAILELERQAFVPVLQVTAEKLEQRFALGHRMSGIWEDARLAALISCCHIRFSPTAPEEFPGSLAAITTMAQPADADTLLFYNLETAPAARGQPHAARLARSALDAAKAAGLTRAVAIARPGSYNGSLEHPQEHVLPQPAFKQAVDTFLAGGPFPALTDLLRDPVLALYYRLSGERCRFLWILPGVMPEDRPSGGIRVIAYMPLADWRRRPAPG